MIATPEEGEPLPEYVLCAANLAPHRPPSSEQDHAPFYHRLPADLGGGAIGQVPFHLHGFACEPPLTNDIDDRAFSNAAFCQLEGVDGATYPIQKIVLDFYGYVRVDDDAGTPDREESPVSVTLESDPGGYDFSRDLDITVRRGSTGDLSRGIIIRGRPDVLLPAAAYVIRPQLGEDHLLLCDGLFDTTPPTPVAAFEYNFKLWSDCNRNGVDDETDITLDPVLDIWPMDGLIDECHPELCEPDYNGDGNVDQDDVDDLLACIGGDCSRVLPQANPDFNHDGNVDQDDVSALINRVAGNGCPA
ncbi:MAG: hypothetical protein DYG92_13135 [Leptolyngbya sp. PLA1]|nr:hypothetical protein [Leptolyngbya sp. PLA1]